MGEIPNYGSWGYPPYYLNKLKEKEDLYEEYDNCLYVIIKSLEEKGIEAEIKLIQFHGTMTTYRSSDSK